MVGETPIGKEPIMSSFSGGIGVANAEPISVFYTAMTIAASGRTPVTRDIAVGDVVVLDTFAASNVPNDRDTGATTGSLNVSFASSATIAQQKHFIVTKLDEGDSPNQIIDVATSRRKGGRIQVIPAAVSHRVRCHGGGGGIAIGGTLAVELATNATAGRLVPFTTVTTAADQKRIVAVAQEALAASTEGFILVSFG
jgi:hypothetical protein